MSSGAIGLALTAFVVASVALVGCGHADTAHQSASAPSRAGTYGRSQDMPMVEIVGRNHRWQVRLVDNPSTRDLLAQLPLKLTLKDYAGTEKIADLPKKLTREGAPPAITPVEGDVTFYAPWGNLAIFYRDGHHSPGLIPLGRIVGDPAGLDQGGDLEVALRSAAEN